MTASFSLIVATLALVVSAITAWMTLFQRGRSRGSGFYVPETGLAKNHHFLLPKDGTSFHFVSGLYKLQVYITEVGSKGVRQIFTVTIEINIDLAKGLAKPNHGLYFDWGPDSGRYAAHIRKESHSEAPPFLREMLTTKAHSSMND